MTRYGDDRSRWRGGQWHGRAWAGLDPRWDPRGGWGGPRVRRGDIPAALLAALLDGPAHGYELIRRLEERSSGTWRPSAGSVYPTLQLLEEQGLVTAHSEEAKRVYELTESGRAEAERARDRQPWSTDEPGAPNDLRRGLQQLVLAVRQVALAGEPAHVEAAVGIVAEARQRLYRLLAE